MGVPKTILILGTPEDEHALHVSAHLAERGARVVWLDGEQFPTKPLIAFQPGSTGHLVDPDSGQRIDFADVESVYWRCYSGNPYSDLPNVEQAELAVNDSRSLFESLLIDLPARWVNGWAGFQIHQCKPAALARVARLDLGPLVRVPETLLSNDPAAIIEFAERVGKCIFKPVQGGAHTRRLAADQLTPDRLELLKHAPVTIQQEIVGTDIRVFIAGERLMACELLTDALDFRDDDDPKMQAIELPSEVATACRRIAASLDLVWTGIDLRRTPAGEYFYFESNPSPMFIGFESRSGLPLTDSLVDLLIGE